MWSPVDDRFWLQTIHCPSSLEFLQFSNRETITDLWDLLWNYCNSGWTLGRGWHRFTFLRLKCFILQFAHAKQDHWKYFWTVRILVELGAAGGDGLQPEGGRCLRRQTCKMWLFTFTFPNFLMFLFKHFHFHQCRKWSERIIGTNIFGLLRILVELGAAGGDELQPEGGRCLRRQTCKMWLFTFPFTFKCNYSKTFTFTNVKYVIIQTHSFSQQIAAGRWSLPEEKNLQNVIIHFHFPQCYKCNYSKTFTFTDVKNLTIQTLSILPLKKKWFF